MLGAYISLVFAFTRNVLERNELLLLQPIGKCEVVIKSFSSPRLRFCRYDRVFRLSGTDF